MKRKWCCVRPTFAERSTRDNSNATRSDEKLDPSATNTKQTTQKHACESIDVSTFMYSIMHIHIHVYSPISWFDSTDERSATRSRKVLFALLRKCGPSKQRAAWQTNSRRHVTSTARRRRSCTDEATILAVVGWEAALTRVDASPPNPSRSTHTRTDYVVSS